MSFSKLMEAPVINMRTKFVPVPDNLEKKLIGVDKKYSSFYVGHDDQHVHLIQYSHNDSVGTPDFHAFSAIIDLPSTSPNYQVVIDMVNRGVEEEKLEGLCDLFYMTLTADDVKQCLEQVVRCAAKNGLDNKALKAVLET